MIMVNKISCGQNWLYLPNYHITKSTRVTWSYVTLRCGRRHFVVLWLCGVDLWTGLFEFQYYAYVEFSVDHVAIVSPFCL